MDLQKLRALVLLADTGSYSEAAERLYMTQSNVSKQVQALEKEWNVQLVDRSRRAIQLTPQGEVAVRHARGIVGDCDALLRDLAGMRPKLRLAALPVMAHYGITGLLAAFQEAYPEVDLEVQEVEGANLMAEELRDGKHELAILRTFPGEQKGLDKLVFCTDRLAAALPRQHPLAGRVSLSLRELAGERLALLDHNSVLHGMIQDACAAAGFTPNMCYAGRRIENILELVADGFGVSLLMEKAAAYLDNENVLLIPIEKELVSEISLMRPKGRHTPLCDLFWQFAADTRRKMAVAR